MSKITEPGIHDISDEAYNDEPCSEPSLRSSVARLLVSPGGTPRHAWWKSALNPNFAPENKRAFDIGKAAHKIILGKGAEIVQIDGDDYARNEPSGIKASEKREARDLAWSEGKIPLLRPEVFLVNQMALAVNDQVSALVAAGTIDRQPFTDGQTEKTLVWRDKRTGVLCRARLDGLPDDAEAINEFKTTSASADPALWQYRQMRPMGFAFSLAWYRRGLEALGLAFSPHFRFFVVETQPPYCMSFIRVDDELIAAEDEKVSRALKIWARCLASNEWPSYSVEGYDVSLTEKEQMREAQEQPRSEHIPSEHMDGYSGVASMFKKRGL